MEELDRNEQHADDQQDEGDVGVVEGVQERLDEVLVDRYDGRALRVDDDLTAVVVTV
jgi:hypothetical protein